MRLLSQWIPVYWLACLFLYYCSFYFCVGLLNIIIWVGFKLFCDLLWLLLRYEPYLWENERQSYQRHAVLFGFFVQLNRLYTDTVQKLPTNSESNIMRCSSVPRFKYLPIRLVLFYLATHGCFVSKHIVWRPVSTWDEDLVYLNFLNLLGCGPNYVCEANTIDD